MPLLIDLAQSGSARLVNAAHCATVGLINNMPDSALEATERQFIDLIGASTRKVAVRLLLFAIPEVPRDSAARRQMHARYRDVAEMWDMPLDGLIVTGTEPKSRNLKDEPYWGALAKVIDWAQDHTASTIWSCLAAHAAVLRTDGIERRLLLGKRSGVFDCSHATPHPMTRNMSFPIRVPHSRLNEIDEAALKACGYRILSHSAAAGVDLFARHGRSYHLFLQGHPEYEADTLLREYRRDIGRYLRRERDQYPAAPQNYFGSEATAATEAFRSRAMIERRPDLLDQFPLRMLQTKLAAPWRNSAISVYENWFGYLQARKAERRTIGRPMRRVWRDWPKEVGIASSLRSAQ